MYCTWLSNKINQTLINYTGHIGEVPKPINKGGYMKLVLITMGCYHAEQQLLGLVTSVSGEETCVFCC